MADEAYDGLKRCIQTRKVGIWMIQVAQVIDQKAAPRVPDEVVDRGSPRSLPDSTAGIATWLDARGPSSRG